MIKDSGDRTLFESGAVRDLRVGKGRCDLLPLDVVCGYLDSVEDTLSHETVKVLENIYFFKEDADVRHLEDALEYFVRLSGWQNHNTMLLEVAVQFEEGAAKYGDSNWQKGIPVRCYIDSAIRHYLKWCRGDNDEPHDRAFCWNILCGIWTCIHKPELNDYAKKEEECAPITDGANHCCMCGEVIPEGFQVCYSCQSC